MDIIAQTLELKHQLELLKTIYEQNTPPEDRKDKQFFLKVKKETEPIYQLLEQWEQTALEIVKARKVNVHPNQITSTRENMALLLMHSYYIDVRRKRYMELIRAVCYVFDQLLYELDKN